jgi:hypothetical protein
MPQAWKELTEKETPPVDINPASPGKREGGHFNQTSAEALRRTFRRVAPSSYAK